MGCLTITSFPFSPAWTSIDIPKSREVKLKTPTRKPEIREAGERRIYTWVVKDIRPDRLILGRRAKGDLVGIGVGSEVMGVS